MKRKRTPAEIAERIAKRRGRRAKRKQYFKSNPVVRDYRLYALKLEQGKYYIGLTAYKDVRRRYDQHAEGIGSKWTGQYPPIGIIEVREIGVLRQADACILEDEMTYDYMQQFGEANVRGGSICMLNDSLAAQKFLKQTKNRFRGATHTSTLEQIDEEIARLMVRREKLLKVESRNQEIVIDKLNWIN